MTFHVSVLTMTPDAFPGALGVSLIGRAMARDQWRLDVVDLKPFSDDPRGFLDDTPAGGGAGQVLKAPVVAAALDSLNDTIRPRIVLSARGRSLTQARIDALAAGPGLIALCGRFEGIDQRVIDARGFEEISIGDYVLAGGDVAAQVVVEAVVRKLPGVLGGETTLIEESYAQGLLEYPQYTRPRVWDGLEIPDILLSGDHGRIAKWRQTEAERTTRERRPDLWARYKNDVPE
jgi:tRNA (guanine37-N1)-methyltransferase